MLQRAYYNIFHGVVLIKYKKSARNLGKSLYFLIIMHAEGEIC